MEYWQFNLIHSVQIITTVYSVSLFYRFCTNINLDKSTVNGQDANNSKEEKNNEIKKQRKNIVLFLIRIFNHE